ncbi:RHS repeat-associated core domain-containing protein [Streptomyces alkaliphilus]|uniref:RHS repeat-associated core domain-containing protein n=1 Tax=Streptomyces alkaliphilus TaxID=1472722 RepID=UPI00389B239D
MEGGGVLGVTEDEATGLVHLGAREYDPAPGRFLSLDPIMDPLDLRQIHGYVHANSNPLAFFDPTGPILCRSTGRTGCLQRGTKTTPAATTGPYTRGAVRDGAAPPSPEARPSRCPRPTTPGLLRTSTVRAVS